MVSMIHLAVLAGFHISQLDLHVISRLSDKCGYSYNYFVTGEDDKLIFIFPAIQLGH
jgi:hypothetical protein